MEEDLLFCQPLRTTATAEDVMEDVETFFTKHSLEWDKLASVCTDGTPAMLGARSGFIQLIGRTDPNVTGMHCIHSPGGIGKKNTVTIIEERTGHSDKTGDLREVQRFKQPIVL